MNSPEQPSRGLRFDSMPNLNNAAFGDVVDFFSDDLFGKYLTFHEYDSKIKYWFVINRVSVIEGRVLVDTNGPDGKPLVHEFDGQSDFEWSIYEPGDLWFQDKEWNKTTNNGQGSEVWWGIYDEPFKEIYMVTQEN